MKRLILNLPLIVILGLIGAGAMYIPAIHALMADDHLSARIFFYSGTLFLGIWSMVALATANHVPRHQARSHLLSLVGAFLILPVMLALPMKEVIQDTTYMNVYLDMVSALTTTGAPVFEDPNRMTLSAHLWRALVAWLGGALIWIVALAILAPLRLGGFEVTTPPDGGTARVPGQQVTPSQRILRATQTLFPIYLFLTGNLWLLLMLSGQPGTHAMIHAMSTVATSGISAMGGVQNASSGFWGELAIFVFLFFAVSRQTFAADLHRGQVIRLIEDRELRIAMVAVVLLPVALFLRHWVGALEVDQLQDGFAALRALWGSAFTVLSFLTTTGFESADWIEAKNWSGLNTPGILLVGLALFGGGVATTAGGVKLLRVYALYKHGRREMDLLIHPSSVPGSRARARRISFTGVEAAWVFFMLFALSIAATSGLLALSGLDFETAIVLACAALSTTGPLSTLALEPGVSWNVLPEFAKVVLVAAMVLGRLETLALIALFNPEFWRR